MGHLLAEQPLRNVGFAEALVQGDLRVAVAFLDPATWSTDPIGSQELRGVGGKVYLSRATPRGPDERDG